MLCPECQMEMFKGRCITLGCIHYRFRPYWDVQEVEDELPIGEDNHFA